MGLAAAAACCMVGGAGGGLPLAAGHENSGSVGCAEQRTGRAVCVGVGADSPDGVFLVVTVGDFVVNFDGVQRLFLGAKALKKKKMKKAKAGK